MQRTALSAGGTAGDGSGAGQYASGLNSGAPKQPNGQMPGFARPVLFSGNSPGAAALQNRNANSGGVMNGRGQRSAPNVRVNLSAPQPLNAQIQPMAQPMAHPAALRTGVSQGIGAERRPLMGGVGTGPTGQPHAPFMKQQIVTSGAPRTPAGGSEQERPAQTYTPAAARAAALFNESKVAANVEIPVGPTNGAGGGRGKTFGAGEEKRSWKETLDVPKQTGAMSSAAYAEASAPAESHALLFFNGRSASSIEALRTIGEATADPHPQLFGWCVTVVDVSHPPRSADIAGVLERIRSMGQFEPVLQNNCLVYDPVRREAFDEKTTICQLIEHKKRGVVRALVSDYAARGGIGGVSAGANGQVGSGDNSNRNRGNGGNGSSGGSLIAAPFASGHVKSMSEITSRKFLPTSDRGALQEIAERASRGGSSGGGGGGGGMSLPISAMARSAGNGNGSFNALGRGGGGLSGGDQLPASGSGSFFSGMGNHLAGRSSNGNAGAGEQDGEEGRLQTIKLR